MRRGARKQRMLSRCVGVLLLSTVTAVADTWTEELAVRITRLHHRTAAVDSEFFRLDIDCDLRIENVGSKPYAVADRPLLLRSILKQDAETKKWKSAAESNWITASSEDDGRDVRMLVIAPKQHIEIKSVKGSVFARFPPDARSLSAGEQRVILVLESSPGRQAEPPGTATVIASLRTQPYLLRLLVPTVGH